MRATLLGLVGLWWLAHVLHIPVVGAVAGMLLLNFVPGAALDWIRTRSPRDAVFLQPLRRVGTEPILVHGERRVWLGFADVFYRATFFDSKDRPPIPQPVWNELQHRDSLQRRAFSNDSLAAGDLEDLRSRPWPVYVWWDSFLAEGRLSPTLSDTVRVSRPVFETPSVRILQLRARP